MSTTLVNAPLPLLKQMLALLEQVYPPVSAPSAQKLASEQGRLEIMAQAAARQVVEDIRGAIANHSGTQKHG